MDDSSYLAYERAFQRVPARYGDRQNYASTGPQYVLLWLVLLAKLFHHLDARLVVCRTYLPYPQASRENQPWTGCQESRS